jgi:hypothetical protein
MSEPECAARPPLAPPSAPSVWDSYVPTILPPPPIPRRQFAPQQPLAATAYRIAVASGLLPDSAAFADLVGQGADEGAGGGAEAGSDGGRKAAGKAGGKRKARAGAAGSSEADDAFAIVGGPGASGDGGVDGGGGGRPPVTARIPTVEDVRASPTLRTGVRQWASIQRCLPGLPHRCVGQRMWSHTGTCGVPTAHALLTPHPPPCRHRGRRYRVGTSVTVAGTNAVIAELSGPFTLAFQAIAQRDKGSPAATPPSGGAGDVGIVSLRASGIIRSVRAQWLAEEERAIAAAREAATARGGSVAGAGEEEATLFG